MSFVRHCGVQCNVFFIYICSVPKARGHMKFPVNRHSWPSTKKLSFKVGIVFVSFDFFFLLNSRLYKVIF